jgi:phenylalanyl-tRNA synthetase alpha subunit
MRVFFEKMGIERVRFKPAYNPYTEVYLSFPVLALLLITIP